MFMATGAIVANAFIYVSNWGIIRHYTLDLHGAITWLMGLATLAMYLTDLGLASKGSVRRIAQARANGEDLNEAISSLITIPTLLALAAAGVVLGVVGSTGAEQPVAAMTAVWVVCMAIQRAARTLAIGFERMGWTLMLAPIAELGKLLWVGVCWTAGLNFKWLLIGWTVVFMLSAVLSGIVAIVLSRQCGFGLRIRLTSLGKTLATLREAFPYYLPQLWLIGAPMALRLVIGASWPDKTISIFQVFWSLAVISRLAALPIGQAVFPRIVQAESLGQGHLATGQVLRSSARILGLVSSAQLALLWAFGCRLLPAVYGKTVGLVYVDHMAALLVFVFALAIENISILLDQVLMATTARLLAGIEVGKIALMTLAVWFAVPTYGVLGAAYAYLGVIVLATIVKLVLTQRRIEASGAGALTAMLATFAATAVAGKVVGVWWAILVASLVAAIATRLLRFGDLQLWMQTGWRVIARRRQTSTSRK